MELKHFRLIKTIVEEGNMANSSEKLFLTQSALSHQLREMEQQLGFKVFFRTRNNWELSEQGVELYRLAKDIFARMEEGFSQIKHINEGAKGKVRIGTECYSFYQGLPSFILKMAILYPQIEADLVLDATLQPIAKLLSFDIDIAIVSAKPGSNRVSCIELYEDEIVCLMHEEHIFADRTHLEAGDFVDMHVIIHSFPLETVSVFSHFLTPMHVTPKKISAIPFTSVSLEMVAVNMGVMCAPMWMLKTFKKSEQLISKPIGGNGLKRTQYLVYRTEDESKQYISDFISNFTEEFLHQRINLV